MQQQLKELNLDKPVFVHCPALLGTQPGTPEHEQFNSAHEDTKEDEGNATSALDTELNASTGKEMDATGRLACMPSAERRQ